MERVENMTGDRVRYMMYKVSAQRHFENNRPDYFIGRIRWYNRGQYVYAENTGIIRTTTGDALEDARHLAKERTIQR